MVDRLLLATIGTLLVIAVIDVFDIWYARFLERRLVDSHLRKRLRQLVWAVLAVSFWSALVHMATPDQRTFPYFLFVLFIYSLRGLIVALLPANWRMSVRTE